MRIKDYIDYKRKEKYRISIYVDLKSQPLSEFINNEDIQNRNKFGKLLKYKSYDEIFNYYINLVLGDRCKVGFLYIIVSAFLLILPIISVDFVNNIFQSWGSETVFYFVVFGLLIALDKIKFSKYNYKRKDGSKYLEHLKKDSLHYIFLSDDKVNENLMDYLNNEYDEILKIILAIFGLSIPIYKYYGKLSCFDSKIAIQYIGLIVLIGAIGYYEIAMGYEKTVFKKILEQIKMENIILNIDFKGLDNLEEIY